MGRVCDNCGASGFLEIGKTKALCPRCIKLAKEMIPGRPQDGGQQQRKGGIGCLGWLGIGSVAIVILMGYGKYLQDKKNDSSKEAGQTQEQRERLSCIEYSKALITRAHTCKQQGADIAPQWLATTSEGLPTQLAACSVSDFSWKGDKAGTEACVRRVKRIECSTFNNTKWLDGPPCVNH